MSEVERVQAARTDPEWQKFLGIPVRAYGDDSNG